MLMPQQIVPLISPQLGVAPVAPVGHLTYHGGPVLSNAQVYTIFWGAAWQQAPQNALVDQLNQFFDFILTSTLIDLLSQYGVPDHAIGHGTRIGTATIVDSEPGTAVADGREVTDAQIQQAIQNWINNNTLPAATDNTLYFVYLPPGVTSILGAARSCQAFCGYHGHVGNTTIYYAVEPYLTCGGCTFGNGQVFDSLTKVSSHELCEAITDPALNAWFEDTAPNNEIGDICNSSQQQLGPYTVQLEWSNVDNACLLVPSVMGDIRVKWLALGGPDSFLGQPVTYETTAPDGVGRFNHFQGGSIYWTPSTGAFEVNGDIRGKWASLGWERSFLGYPLTDESAAPDGVGRFNHFQGGSIYWTPSTGAFEVNGAIRDMWASLGWERSGLGYPTSDEQDGPNGSRISHFEHGNISWTSSGGAVLA